MKFRGRPNIPIISDLLKEGFQWSNEKSAGTKEIETKEKEIEKYKRNRNQD